MFQFLVYFCFNYGSMTDGFLCFSNQSINGMAHLKQTQYGKVDLDYVLGIGGFDLER